MFAFFMLMFIFAVYYILPATLVVAFTASILTLIDYVLENRQELYRNFKRKKKRS